MGNRSIFLLQCMVILCVIFTMAHTLENGIFKMPVATASNTEIPIAGIVSAQHSQMQATIEGKLRITKLDGGLVEPLPIEISEQVFVVLLRGRNAAERVFRETSINGNGEYTFPNVPNGTYTVMVENRSDYPLIGNDKQTIRLSANQPEPQHVLPDFDLAIHLRGQSLGVEISVRSSDLPSVLSAEENENPIFFPFVTQPQESLDEEPESTREIKREDVPTVRAASVSQNVLEILSSDLAAGDWFGDAVAIDGDTSIIGAFYKSDVATKAGAAYIFTKTGSAWVQDTKLVASDAGSNDVFGFSVAISGNKLVIGAPSWRDINGIRVGAAYVFTKVGSTWNEETILTAPDGADADEFGIGVSIEGNTIIVGAWKDDDNGVDTGSAYVYNYSGSTWSYTEKLLGSDSTTGDKFGKSIGIDNGTMVIGAQFSHVSSPNGSGAAYIFEVDQNSGNWSEIQKITAGDPGSGDWFGAAVAIHNGTIVSAAPREDTAASNAGAIYVFEKSGSNWVQEAKLAANDAAADDWLGRYTIDVDGEYIAAGAPYSDNMGAYSGAAYIFKKSGGVWSEEVKIEASNLVAGDVFGLGNALNGDTVLIGAEQADRVGTDSGTAYVYSLAPPSLVTQLSPLNSIVDTVPSFEWRPEATATGYVIALYDVTNDTVLFYNNTAPYTTGICTGNDPLTDTCTAQPGITFTPGLSYAWLVYAFNDNGNGSWSVYP